MSEISAQCIAFCPNRGDCAKRLGSAVREGDILEKQENAWKVAAIAAPMVTAERQADLAIKSANLVIEHSVRDLVNSALPDIGKRVHDNLDYLQESLDYEASMLEKNEQIIVDTLVDLEDRRAKNVIETSTLEDTAEAIDVAAIGCDGPGLSFLGRVVMKRDQLLGRPHDPDLYLEQYARCSNDEVVALTDAMPEVTRMYVPLTEE